MITNDTTDGAKVFILDPSTGTKSVLTTLPVLTGPAANTQPGVIGLAADSTSVWVTAEYQCTGVAGTCRGVFKVSLSTGQTSILYQAQAPTDIQPIGAGASAGNYLYFMDASYRVFRLAKTAPAAWALIAGASLSGSLDETGQQAWFGGLSAIESDGSALWAVDAIAKTIRKLSPGVVPVGVQPAAWSTTLSLATGTTTTLAGTTTSGYADGTGTAARFIKLGAAATVGPDLYVADEGRIRKINKATKRVATVALYKDVCDKFT